MIPVRQSDGDLFIVLRPVRVFGIMYDILATETIWILATRVGVVPIRSWLVDGKVVRETRAWRKATLRDTDRAIHVVSAVLEETMEVDAGALVSKLQRVSMVEQAAAYISSYLVVHTSNHLITFCEVEQRKWPLSIDSHDGTFSHSIRVGSYPSDIPIECDRCRICHCGEGRKARQEALQ